MPDIILTDNWSLMYSTLIDLVSFPDPTLKEGKGLVYVARFLGLDDISVLNSLAPIRFTPCGISVIIL